MTPEERLKILMDSGKYDFIKDIPFEQTGSYKKWTDEVGSVICSECKRIRGDCRYGHTQCYVRDVVINDVLRIIGKHMRGDNNEWVVLRFL